MRRIIAGAAVLVGACAVLHAQSKSFDPSAAFGARPSVTGMRLSPDGAQVAYIAPTEAGQGNSVVTIGLGKSISVHRAGVADGNPLRLTGCDWVSDQRLACSTFGVIKEQLRPYTRILSFDADGKDPRSLNTSSNDLSVIDASPDEDGAVLVATRYSSGGSDEGFLAVSSHSGLGVDRIDTRTLATRTIERPDDSATQYITDGHGTVRIMGVLAATPGGGAPGAPGAPTLATHYLYRTPGSRDWRPLSSYNLIDRSGFQPLAVDRDLDVAYGLKTQNGHLAVYTVKLDGSLTQTLVFAAPGADVDRLIQLGRTGRVVGASYMDQFRHWTYFDPDLKQLLAALSRAVPDDTLRIVDESDDHNKLLVLAGSPSDPGIYYLFDRAAKRLDTFLPVRKPLEGVLLATVKPTSYPAADGTAIPALLTLPPGRKSARGLPGIVLPLGGLPTRDDWGFDWLAQFFAYRGYAVLQPGYRGSPGFADAWLQKGAPSWSTAVGDVLAGGRWLVKQGIVSPGKLAVAGWSFGGYAALQSAVMDPGLFKAVIAIDPITDLSALREKFRMWGDASPVASFVGSGSAARDGSPVEHADQITAPVLLFHAAEDLSSPIKDSTTMDARLKAAGKVHQLVTWDTLDGQLEDSAARQQLLQDSDDFLRKALQL